MKMQKNPLILIMFKCTATMYQWGAVILKYLISGGLACSGLK